MLIVAGEYSLSTFEGTEQIFRPARMVLHPDYSASSKNADIMLIKVTPNLSGFGARLSGTDRGGGEGRQRGGGHGGELSLAGHFLTPAVSPKLARPLGGTNRWGGGFLAPQHPLGVSALSPAS